MYSKKADQCIKEGKKKLKGNLAFNSRKFFWKPDHKQIITGRISIVMLQTSSY